jgi:uncharacterized protein YegP (UPF0339 family)
MFEVDAAIGGYYWRLKGANGETLCHSEVYTSKQSALAGVAAVQRIVPTARVVDKTLKTGLAGFYR